MIIFVAFEPRRKTKPESKPALKTNPFKTLRDKNRLLNRDKMERDKLENGKETSNKPKRVKVNRVNVDNDLETDGSSETTTYRYVPKRTYPTYKGNNGGGRGGFMGRNREKQKFKIHNEFHEDWLKYPNKDEEDEMSKYFVTSTEKEKRDWYAESATEVATNEVPFELMRDKGRVNNKPRRNDLGKSGSTRQRNNMVRHDNVSPKLSEDTTTSTLNFATVFEPEIGLTSLFDLGAIRKRNRGKNSEIKMPSLTQAPKDDEDTESETTKKNTSIRPSTTSSFAADKAGIPRPSFVGSKMTKPKPRVKMVKKVSKKKMNDNETDKTAYDKLDKGAIVEVNRVRVTPATEAPLTSFVKPTTVSPISPQRRASIHRRLDRYSSQLGKKSKLPAVTTTTQATVSSYSASKNRRLPPRKRDPVGTNTSDNSKKAVRIRSKLTFYG